MESITELFTDSSTYSSANTGIFLGKDQIMTMMSNFHNSFEELNWDIIRSDEIKPNIIKIDFTFSGIPKQGNKIQSLGIEYIVIHKDKIQHIEIQNKV